MSSGVIGIIAGIFTSLSLLPQLIKMIRERKCCDLSVMTFIILLIGLALWVCYGVTKGDWPIIVTNGFSLLTNVAVLVFYYWYKRKELRSKY